MRLVRVSMSYRGKDLNRGDHGKTDTTEAKVFYFIITNFVTAFRPSLLETAK